MASRTASEIWSAILSGCPSVTDSEVKTWRCAGMFVSGLPLDVQPSRPPPPGQPDVRVQQSHIDRFRESETQNVERVLRALRLDRRGRGGARIPRAHLPDDPLDHPQ